MGFKVVVLAATYPTRTHFSRLQWNNQPMKRTNKTEFMGERSWARVRRMESENCESRTQDDRFRFRISLNAPIFLVLVV